MNREEDIMPFIDYLISWTVSSLRMEATSGDEQL